MRLVYLAAARRDIADILKYLTQESGNLLVGQKFTGRLRQQCQKLASLPGTLGRARPELLPDIRSFAFRGYLILFRYRGDVFEVVKIIEGHRDVEAMFRDNVS